MATTSPDKLWSPNSSDSWAFVTITAAMQSSVQKALTSIRNSFTSELDNMQTEFTTNLRYRVQRRKFASIEERDTWTTANRPSLTIGDVCYVGSAKYVWSGSEWAQQAWGWYELTATKGWTANTGDNAPRVRRDGNVVTFRGGLYGGEAFTQATTLPSWARPNMETTILTWNGTNNGAVAVTVYSNGAMNLGGTLGDRQMCRWTVE